MDAIVLGWRALTESPEGVQLGGPGIKPTEPCHQQEVAEVAIIYWKSCATLRQNDPAT